MAQPSKRVIFAEVVVRGQWAGFNRAVLVTGPVSNNFASGVNRSELATGHFETCWRTQLRRNGERLGNADVNANALRAIGR